MLKKKIIAYVLATLSAFSVLTSTAVNAEELNQGFENQDASLKISQTARYSSGITNPDGGVMEIVAYNPAVGKSYAVNGQTGVLTMISTQNISNSTTVDELSGIDIDVKSLIEDESFAYGDMTSVAVSPDGKLVAVAVQAESYSANGRAVVFLCNEDGTLEFYKSIETGVQPDMITFTPDGTKILTANEGEPREGYTEESVDPMGTVTVVNTGDYNAVTVDFTKYDDAQSRQSLADKNVIIKKNTAPSVDFEPEYIAVSDEFAYVSLQEANAVAVLDLNSLNFKDVYSVGFEDYSFTPVDIDKKDEHYNPETYESLRGIRMPDGISLADINGEQYIITANEGDSREWTDYLNEDERNFGKGKTSPTGKITAENSGLTGKVVFFDTSDYDGLDENYDYLFGGRSFTIFKVTENGLVEVFTSSDDFEKLTATYFKDNFNCSNDDIAIDDRSGKKGPEPETVVTGKVGEKTYAFIALERIGGIMVYDITDAENPEYVNYINSRDFSSEICGDVSPEGLCFVPSEKSADANAYLIAACEVSGTVAVYSLNSKEETKGLYGDVDCDGIITVKDATIVQKLSLGAETEVSITDFVLKAADVNGDGRLSILDVTCIQKYIAGGYNNVGTTGEPLVL